MPSSIDVGPWISSFPALKSSLWGQYLVQRPAAASIFTSSAVETPTKFIRATWRESGREKKEERAEEDRKTRRGCSVELPTATCATRRQTATDNTERCRRIPQCIMKVCGACDRELPDG